jgi:hypothetical protein
VIGLLNLVAADRIVEVMKKPTGPTPKQIGGVPWMTRRRARLWVSQERFASAATVATQRAQDIERRLLKGRELMDYYYQQQKEQEKKG